MQNGLLLRYSWASGTTLTDPFYPLLLNGYSVAKTARPPVLSATHDGIDSSVDCHSVPLGPSLGLAPAIAGWPTEVYRIMVAAIQKSGNVVLYEGLPHQETEAAQLQAELK